MRSGAGTKTKRGRLWYSELELKRVFEREYQLFFLFGSRNMF